MNKLKKLTIPETLLRKREKERKCREKNKKGPIVYFPIIIMPQYKHMN